MDPVFRKYLLVHAADWLLLGILGWIAVRWFDVALWIPAAVLTAWIIKDLLLFRSTRWYYEPQPPERRMVGEEGEALGTIDPDGFARVHGEIWQVHVPPGHRVIQRGERIRVRDVDGLHLLVEPAPATPARE